MMKAGTPIEARRAPRSSVVLKTTLLTAVIVAVLLGALLTFGNRFWHEILREEIDARLSAVAASRRAIVHTQLALYRQRAVLNTDRGEFRSFLGQLVAGNFSEKDRGYSEHSLKRITADGLTHSAMLVEPGGSIMVASDPAKVGRSLASDAVFMVGMKEVRIGVPQRVGTGFEVRVAAPVRSFSPPEKICGVLVLDVETSDLAEALRDITGLGRTGEVLLGVREDRAIRILFPTRFRSENITLPLADAPAMVAAIEGHERLAHNRDYRGEPVLAVGAPVGYGGWGLVAKMDEAEAYAPIASALRYGLGLGAIIALVGLVASYGVARHGLTVRERRIVAGFDRGLGKVALACALTVVALGLATLACGLLQIKPLKILSPSLASMRPSTALCFVLAGTALWLRRHRGLRLGCAWAVLMLCGLELAQEMALRPFDTGQFLFLKASSLLRAVHLDRMSPVTASIFILFGISLLLLGTCRAALRRTGEALAIFAGWAGLYAVLSYAFGVDVLHQLSQSDSVAPHSAAGFVLLAIGILCTRADGIAGTFASAGLGGQIARRFLPLTIGLPLVLGWLVMIGEHAALFTSKEKTAVFVTSMMLMLAVLVWRNARSLDASDAERSEAEAKLRESEERLRLALGAAGMGVAIADLTPGGALIFDAQARAILGLEADRREWTIQEFLAKLVHPDDREHLQAALVRVMKLGHGSVVEYRIVRPDDAVRWLQGSATTQPDASGVPSRFICVSFDITERVQAEAARRESEEHIRTIGDRLPGGAIYRFGIRSDGSQFFTHLSAGFLRSTGYSPQELLTHPGKMFEAILPEDAAVMERATRESAEALTPFDHQFRRRMAATGEVRWFHSRSMPRRLGDGTVVWDGVEFDITEKKHAENALRESEERLRLVIDSVPHSIFAKNPAGQFIFVNRAQAAAFGLTPEEMVGRTDGELMPDAAQVAQFRADDLEVIESGRPKFIAEERRTEADGATRILQTVKVPLPLPGEEKPAVLGVAVDISARKHAEEQLHILNQELESRVVERTAELRSAVTALETENAERRQAEERIRQLNEQLSARVEELAAVNAELEAFGYTVSHDLRAPLRHVVGFIRLLSEGAAGKLDPGTAEYLPLIANAAARMGQLIDGLLRFSRLGRASLQWTEVDTQALAEEVRGTLQLDTAGRSIEWKIGPLPKVQGDLTMLRQVLANLIGNAVKFTRSLPAATIEITCDSATAEHVFRISDNGVGFDPAHAGKLFGVFQRLHTVTEFEGTGIGLATVRRIITRHGGRTWAESQPGQGARFYFSLAKS